MIFSDVVIKKEGTEFTAYAHVSKDGCWWELWANGRTPHDAAQTVFERIHRGRDWSFYGRIITDNNYIPPTYRGFLVVYQQLQQVHSNCHRFRDEADSCFESTADTGLVDWIELYGLHNQGATRLRKWAKNPEETPVPRNTPVRRIPNAHPIRNTCTL